MQSMLMTDPADKLDPMSLLFYMSSFSVMLLLPSALILEPGVFGEVRHASHDVRASERDVCVGLAACEAERATAGALLQTCCCVAAQTACCVNCAFSCAKIDWGSC
jgi:hypothetical protein